ncbi:MAG: RNA polymerase sigma-70 factor [Bacteroidetes bacterium]|nr:RNA polymerase sigma-70 factor [Bacteroidota bacterium]
MSLEENNLDNDRPLPSFNATMFDDAAFKLFFKKHFTTLCGYCQFKFDFDLDQAKDIVHTGFLRLWENRQRISPELSIKAYIYQIVHNICLDTLKSDKVRRRHIQYIKDHSSEVTRNDSLDFKQLEEMIEKAIEEFPPQMRRIFELSRKEELRYAEIAGQLGISVKTVETQMGRALAKLRKKLTGPGKYFFFFL